MKVAEPLIATRRTLTSGASAMGTIPPSSSYRSFSFCADLDSHPSYHLFGLLTAYCSLGCPAELPQSGKAPE